MILAHVEEAEADLQATADLITGTVRVAAIQSAGLYLLAPALRTARRRRTRRCAWRSPTPSPRPRCPRSRSAASTWCWPTSTRSSPARPTRAWTSSRCTRSTSTSCSRASIRWRSNARVPIAALKDEPWAIGKDDTAYAELTIRACRTFGGFEPDVRHRSNDLLMLLALVSNGQAVTLLPDLVRADREPSVVTRDVADAPLTRTVFGAIRHGSARRPALNALRAALRDTAAGLRSAATPAP